MLTRSRHSLRMSPRMWYGFVSMPLCPG
jgi:hypothetical protein